MKIVYISHPISGNIEDNLTRLREIVRVINLTNQAVVPFVPYYADIVSMDDNNLYERERGIKNGMAVLERRGMFDELWIYGDKITIGMIREISTAFKNKIPVLAGNALLCSDLQILRQQYNK